MLGVLIWSATPDFALPPTRPLAEYYKKYWQTEQNLPGNEVWAMNYAPDGHLLVGTAAGLTRFDGLRFTTLGIDAPVDLAKTLDRRVDNHSRWLALGFYPRSRRIPLS